VMAQPGAEHVLYRQRARTARAARRLIERPRRVPERSPLLCVNPENTRAFVFDRFEREAMAASRLNHRYIVPIDGIGTVDGRWCIMIWRSCRVCWWCFTRSSR
jgi:hypothetical protein